MNRTLRLLLSFFIFHFSFICAFAQSDDFGLDFSASAEKKIRKGMDFTLEGNVRTQDNTSAIERYGLGGTFSMKVLNTKKLDLKLNAGWEYIWQHKLSECEDKTQVEDKYTPNGLIQEEYKGYNLTDSYWRPRHRTTLALGANYAPNKRWSFSLKESVLYNHYGSAEKTTHRFRAEDAGEEPVWYDDKVKQTSSKDRFLLRSKATAKYDVRKSHFAPFASVDYGCGLNYTTSKWKLTLGTDYKLTKTSKLSAFYRFQTENDDDEPDGHIVGLSYGIKF